jgi:hypothetical protein
MSDAVTHHRDPLRRQDWAAEFIGVKPLTHENWRCRRYGPPYVKVGKLVYYRESVLSAWLDEQTVTAEA